MEKTLFDLERMLDEGSISSLELVRYYLHRINQYDKNGPHLNSIGEINPDLEKKPFCEMKKEKKDINDLLYMVFLLS